MGYIAYLLPWLLEVLMRLEKGVAVEALLRKHPSPLIWYSRRAIERVYIFLISCRISVYLLLDVAQAGRDAKTPTHSRGRQFEFYSQVPGRVGSG